MMRSPEESTAQGVTEAIAAQDRNNLYVTSTFLEDSKKFGAFCAYYATMRLLDDSLDNLPAGHARRAK